MQQSRKELKFKKCYGVGLKQDSWNNPYLSGRSHIPPRYGASITLTCNDRDREMLVSHGVKTPYQSDHAVPGSWGTILEDSQILNNEWIPYGAQVDSIPSSLEMPYTLIVTGLCCRYK